MTNTFSALEDKIVPALLRKQLSIIWSHEYNEHLFYNERSNEYLVYCESS